MFIKNEDKKFEETPKNMELELGLKLARVADEFSSADLLIAKDRAGPLFLSTETDSLFILTAHLKGFMKRDVKIEINEDGTQIVISGEKIIQESVYVGWKLHKKETEAKGFRKAFKIPDGVILDKIKAEFDEDESSLTISMPKKEKGIYGFSIEEVKEQDPAREGVSETLQITDDHGDQPEGKMNVRSNGQRKINYAQETDDEKATHVPKTSTVEEVEQQNLEKVLPAKDVERPEETQMGKENEPDDLSSSGKGHKEIDQIQSNEVGEGSSAEGKSPGQNQEDKPLGNKKEKERFKICVPAIAGSAFLISLVVFVIHYVRTKSQPGKKRD